jgi:hypothetical protein
MKPQHDATLVDVFVQRRFQAADGRDRERPDSARLQPCLDLHGIHRERSYLARDGQRILCHFRAPDAESLRMALRGAGIDYDAVWTGAVSHLPGSAEFVLVVERVFERPLSPDQERACRAAAARRLLDLGAEPARVLLSRSRQRLLWLCRAHTPAAIAAVESALAGQGFEVWGCDVVPRPGPAPDLAHSRLHAEPTT